MTLSERLSELVRAMFSGIYIRSFEHDDALAEIAQLCRRQGWAMATGDLDRGLAIAGRARPGPPAMGPIRRPRSVPWAPSPRPTARRSSSFATPIGSQPAPRSSRPSTRGSPRASGTAPSS
jgi:hypothetical protein